MRRGLPRLASSSARYAISLAAPIRAPRHRFLIFCPGRVGSELLVNLLDSHPHIACDGEILDTRHAFPERYVEYRAVRRRKPGIEAYGYKLIVEHLRYLQPIEDPRAWLERQVGGGTVLIALERRNLLQQAMSFVRAKELGWHHTETDRPDRSTVDLDPLDVAAHLHTVAESVTWFHEILDGLPRLELVYEDDLLHPEAQQRTAARIAEALGLEPAPVHTELVRTAPYDPRTSVHNFDEIERLVRASRYAEHLPD